MGTKPLLDAALVRRTKQIDKLDKLTAAPQAEGRTALSDDEATKFEELSAEIGKLDKQIRGFEKQIAREEKAATTNGEVKPELPQGGAVITREQMTYDISGNNSYFRDLGTVAASTKDQSYLGAADDARRRMSQHAKELEVEARKDESLARRLREMRATPAGLESRVNPNTTAGTGGEFVPPLWLVSQYVPFFRPGRVFANRVRNMPLPPGIDIINLPKITTGSQVAIQTANAAPVASVDIVTGTVSASVRTIAGQEDISLQLLEQSPLAMDNVIFQDLSADYDQRLDLQVVAGTGANGQHTGVLNVTGVTANTSLGNASLINCSATGFDGSVASGQYRSIVNGVNQIETIRFANPSAIWAHPRRVNSWALATDSTNRPLFIPAKYGQFNTLGTAEGAPTYQGVAGELFGLPVIKDANMTTVANGTASPSSGGTQDAIVVLNEDDLILWEGTMRMRALPEILSGTLQIRFQLYCYSAFMPNRAPAAISIAVGAGTAAPTF